MAFVGVMPKNDIVLSFSGEGDKFQFRIATEHGRGVAEHIVQRLKPLLKDGVTVDFRLMPSRFAAED